MLTTEESKETKIPSTETAFYCWQYIGYTDKIVIRLYKGKEKNLSQGFFDIVSKEVPDCTLEICENSLKESLTKLKEDGVIDSNENLTEFGEEVYLVINKNKGEQ